MAVVAKAVVSTVFQFGESKYHAHAVPRWPAVEPPVDNLSMRALRAVLSLVSGMIRLTSGSL